MWREEANASSSSSSSSARRAVGFSTSTGSRAPTRGATGGVLVRPSTGRRVGFGGSWTAGPGVPSPAVPAPHGVGGWGCNESGFGVWERGRGSPVGATSLAKHPYPPSTLGVGGGKQEMEEQNRKSRVVFQTAGRCLPFFFLIFLIFSLFFWSFFVFFFNPLLRRTIYRHHEVC